jgi:iron complex outermembrane receptor protein
MIGQETPRSLAGALMLASLALAGGSSLALADESTQLPSITITAQLRSEEMVKVPISAMAVDQQTLDQLGVKDVTDVARLVPGITFQATDDAGDSNIAIRGIISPIGAATTGLYIDDVPVMVRPYDSIGGNPYPKVFDLDRLEVLRGPQGTLFGAGAEGGVLRFITPEASLRKFSGFASADLATTRSGDPSYEAGAAVGGPIVEGRLGYRASIWHREDGGFGDRLDPATGTTLARRDNSSDSTVMHVNLKFAPTSSLVITPGLFFQASHAGDIGMFLESAGTYSTVSQIAQPHDDRMALSTLSVDYDFGAFTFRSISSYLDRRISQNWNATAYELNSILQYYDPGTSATSVPFDPNYLTVVDYHATQRGVTQEFRFTSTDQPGDRMTWVGGLFYRRSATMLHSRYIDPGFNNLSNYLLGGPGLGGTAQDSIDYWTEAPVNGIYSFVEDFPTTETDLAAFGDMSYALTPSLKLSAGLRVARSGYSYTDFQDGPWGPAAPYSQAGSQSETPLTPRVNIAWQIDPQRMAYVSAAKGYRAGGGNEPVPTSLCAPDLAALGMAQVPLAYKSDSLWSFETGLKGRFLDNTVLLESSAYWINWDQIQQAVSLSTCGYNYVANLGHAVSRGFDLQAQWAATKHLVFSVTSGFTDAHLKDTLLVEGQMLTKSGDRLATPTWTFTAGGEYRFAPWSGAEGFARLDYDFNGSYTRMGSVDTFGSDPLVRYAPPVRTASARLGAKVDGWELSAYGNNLFNKDTSLYRYRSTSNTTDLRDMRLRPLTIGISAKYRF